MTLGFILFVLGLTLCEYQKLSIVKIVKTSVNIFFIVHALYHTQNLIILLYNVNCSVSDIPTIRRKKNYAQYTAPIEGVMRGIFL